MERLTILIVTNLLLTLSVFGQNLNTPDEFERIIRRSRVKYDIQEIDGKSIPKEARELLSNDLYISYQTGKKPEVMHYSDIQDEKVKKNEELGDKLTDKGQYDKARKHFNKALKIWENHAGVMAKIGLTYFREENYPEAKAWALRATKVNYIHAPAHLLMANVFMKAGKWEEAMESITLAHLFNRNHREILTKLKLIYDRNGKVYDDTWEFYVPYQIVAEDSSTNVTLLYPGDPWGHYCMCQVVWEEEPFYAQKKKITDADLKMLQEKECLLNLIIDYEHWENKKAKRKFKVGPVLQRAIEKQLIDEFIIYETLLVKEPTKSLMFTPDEIHRLAKYLFEVRSLPKE